MFGSKQFTLYTLESPICGEMNECENEKKSLFIKKGCKWINFCLPCTHTNIASLDRFIMLLLVLCVAADLQMIIIIEWLFIFTSCAGLAVYPHTNIIFSCKQQSSLNNDHIENSTKFVWNNLCFDLLLLLTAYYS